MAQDINEIYKNLTSVDIESQKRLWDERGKGYYGEYLVFKQLYQAVPGTCKILMNLNVPATASRTTEIDLIMIHESGIYVFEVKHYKGTIYGTYSAETWTQYFRTQNNSHFHNPVLQNQYHIQAIQKLIPNVPVYSFVVFTNNEVELKISDIDPKGTVICKLQYLIGLIRQGIYSSQEHLSLEKIDEIFRFLERYAPVMESGFEYDGEVLTFDKYTAAIRNDYSKTVAKIKKEADETVQHAKREYESSLYAGLEAERRRYHRKNITAAAVCAVIAALAVIGAFTVSSYFLTQKNRAEREASAAAAEKAAAVRLSYRKGPGNKAV